MCGGGVGDADVDSTGEASPRRASPRIAAGDGASEAGPEAERVDAEAAACSSGLPERDEAAAAAVAAPPPSAKVTGETLLQS